MKKVIYLMTLSLIFIFGCSNEDSSGLQDPSSADLKFKKLSFDGTTLSSDVTSINMKELQEKTKASTSSKSSGDPGANGHFSTNEGNTVSFSSGDGDEFGNWNMSGVLNFKGDVICATVEGNQAVVQLVITKVGNIPEEASGEIVVGYTHLFLLEDNGEGFNAPKDRYWDYNLYIPDTYDFCLELPPSIYLEIFAGFGVGQFSDTAKKSDQIQVE